MNSIWQIFDEMSDIYDEVNNLILRDIISVFMLSVSESLLGLYVPDSS